MGRNRRQRKERKQRACAACLTAFANRLMVVDERDRRIVLSMYPKEMLMIEADRLARSYAQGYIEKMHDTVIQAWLILGPAEFWKIVDRIKRAGDAFRKQPGQVILRRSGKYVPPSYGKAQYAHL
jgi:hypothetical protein